MKLSDDQVAQIRAQAADGGVSLTEIAQRFGTSKQHVSRLVSGQQRQLLAGNAAYLRGSVVAALEALFQDLGVSPDDDVRAATALALGEKLDAVRVAQSASSAMACPGLAKALSETLIELQDERGATGPRLGRLRGEEAILVARELGYEHPEAVDIDAFDDVEAIRLRRARRRAAAGLQDNGKVA